MNSDYSNAVNPFSNLADTLNPYLSDVGVGLVFGLGYYVINSQFGENNNEKKEKKEAVIMFDNCKTIEDFNILIRQTDKNSKINPFYILDKINKSSLTPDITIYNNLINVCYVKGQFEEAEKLVDEVFDFGSPVQPDISTFNILLKGISLKLESKAEATKEEKQILLDLAEKYFANLKENHNFKPDDVTLNTKMDILIKGGCISKAWELFDEMKPKYKIEPDRYSYTTIIKTFRYECDETKLDKILGIMKLFKETRKCLSTDEIIFNCILDVCLKLGKVDKAELVFKSMSEYGLYPSKISYAIMIRGYGQFYKLDEAFKLFEEMKNNAKIEPNEIIYGCLMNACVRCSNLKKVTQVYLEMQEKDIRMNIILYTTLIKAYAKGKNIDDAFKVYEKMLRDPYSKPNIIAHNAMLDCCVECNNITKMNEIYMNIKNKFLESDESAECPKPDLSTYSTVVKGFSKSKDMEKVFDIYQFLKNSKEFVLDEVIYNTVLDACAKTGNYSLAMEVIEDMNKSTIKKSNVTYSILIKIFSNNKEDEKAIKVFEEMKANGIKPGLIVYTCLIQTCFKSKKFSLGVELFEDMKKMGLKPDHVLFNTIVNGSTYNQNLEVACKYTIESFDYNVRMADEIYNNVSLLCYKSF